MIKLQDKPALLLVDIQKGFENIEYWGGQRNNVGAENNAGKLLSFWRENQLPVFHVQHCSTNLNSPLRPGNPGNELQDVVAPMGSEPVIQKNVNSAFIGTDLQQRLDENGVKKLVVVGLTTDHCISTTIRMAGNLGYDVYVVEDATATFAKAGLNGEKYSAELIHDVTLASLKDEFATVVITDQLISELSD